MVLGTKCCQRCDRPLTKCSCDPPTTQRGPHAVVREHVLVRYKVWALDVQSDGKMCHTIRRFLDNGTVEVPSHKVTYNAGRPMEFTTDNPAAEDIKRVLIKLGRLGRKVPAAVHETREMVILKDERDGMPLMALERV